MTRLSLALSLALAAAASAATSGTRSLTPLGAGWRFKLENPPGAEKAAFDDSGWQALSLPHCWGFEQAERGEKPPRATGWYRRALDIQPAPGRRYFVKLGAASTEADGYVNGEHVGKHRGGFGAFCFEVTKQLGKAGPNTLALRVSNADTNNIAPLSGDFPVYGGLYRDAALLETGDICIDPTQNAAPGVAWLQTEVNKKEALLDVTAQISNGTKEAKDLTLSAKLVDASGKTVAETKQEIKAAPEVTAPYELRVKVSGPHLWQGRKDPYLYRAIVEVSDTSGGLDAVEQQIGLRSLRIDPDKGFLLNDEPYHLHGANIHQERRGKGWAVSKADIEEDVALFEDIGATAVRAAHYQHSDYFYELCDKAGLLVWAEIPQVDRVAASEEFAENSRGQLLDLVRQNINHPSIFCWSLSNELYPSGSADPHRLLQDLKVVANGEDPTRPTILATRTDKWPQANKIPDELGWNVYYGWYSDWPPLSDYGPMREGYRKTSRTGGYAISEYGAGANPAQHEQDPKKPKNDGQWHPEEYQTVVHETAWPQLKAAQYIWGTFVWVMADFTSWWRKEGGAKGLNDKGLVTADRKTKKDAFYYYRANWSDDPTLYIASRRHTERTNAATEVKIYSNAPEVELVLNGTSQGKKKSDGNATFLWENVALKPGANKVEAAATRDDKNLTDTCTWTLKTP